MSFLRRLRRSFPVARTHSYERPLSPSLRVAAKSLLMAALLLAGCMSTTPVSPTFPEAEEPEFGKVLREAKRAPRFRPPPIAVALTAPPVHLMAWDLQKSTMLWTKPVQASSAPVLAGKAVVLEEEGVITARDLRSGKLLFSIRGEGELYGAAGSSDIIAITVSPNDVVQGSVLVAKGGSLAWRGDFAGPVGSPAVIGKLVFVPWGTQHISVLDAETEEQRARLQIRDGVLSHARVYNGDPYVGQLRLFRIDRRMEKGKRSAATFFAPLPRQLPSHPQLFRVGYRPVPEAQHAANRVMLEWHPVSARGSGEISLRDNTLYFVFYRFVFGLGPEEDAIRWAYVHPTDIAAATAQPGGLQLLGEDGESVFLAAADGRARGQGGPNKKLLVGAIPQLPTGALSKDQPSAAKPLREQLLEVAQTNDLRLSAGRTFAIEHLSRISGSDITKELFELCGNEASPTVVRDYACEAAGAQTTGEETVMALLGRRGSFLEAQQPPPVAPLAKAATAMNLRAAGPLLVTHLHDPRTDPAALAAVAEALSDLGSAAQVRALEQFVNTYYLTRDADMLEAVTASMTALTTRLEKGYKPRLEGIRDDALAVTSIRDQARHLIAEVEKPEPAPPADDKPADINDSTLPNTLTSHDTDPVFAEVEGILTRCLPPGGTAKIGVVVDLKGKPLSVFVAPEKFSPCVRPTVDKLSFPSSRGEDRKHVHYNLRRKRAATVGQAPPETAANPQQPSKTTLR